MSDTKKLPATPAEIAERVDYIYNIMARGEWEPGKSGKPLAIEWGISIPRVEQLASEAWRRVARDANNPDIIRPEISAILRKNLHKADKQGSFNAIAKLADTYSKIIGARAPERHEHAVIIAQFEHLDTQGRIAWIDDRIKMLEEAKALLLEKALEE